MAHLPSISLMTPTWAGDLSQFRVLMHSLRKSPLAHYPHTTVVQTEDARALHRVAPSGSSVITTADVLPAVADRRRQRARRLGNSLGRHLTRLAGSLSRTLRWPNWPRFTGWHTQQVCKLAFAAQAQTDYVVAIDSDVIVTPAARLAPLIERPGIACFSEPQRLEAFHGKTRKWVLQADRLLNSPKPDGWYDGYFDTPFLLHTKTVRRMLDWLEERYACPWWQALLAQPPRRWSEFATYKRFLTLIENDAHDSPVDWLSTDALHYIFDASDPKAVVDEVGDQLRDPDTYFITVHSQSSGRGLWNAESFTEELIHLLKANDSH